MAEPFSTQTSDVVLRRPGWLKWAIAAVLAPVALIAGGTAWNGRLAEERSADAPAADVTEFERADAEPLCAPAEALEDLFAPQRTRESVEGGSESPAHLAAAASRVVRGTIEEAIWAGDQLVLFVEQTAELGGRNDQRDVRAFSLRGEADSNPPVPDLEGLEFLAFLKWTTESRGALTPLPEGLWVSCGNEDPAVVIPHSHPGGEWSSEPTISSILGDIRTAQRLPIDHSATKLANGSWAISMELLDGSQFLVTLPEALGNGVEITQITERNEVAQFAGTGFTASARIAYCAPEILSDGVPNALGTTVKGFEPGSVVQAGWTLACLPDHFVQLDIRHNVPLTAQDYEQIGILPITRGSHYQRLITEGRDDCCELVGPVHSEERVFLASGRSAGVVTSLHRESLLPLWKATVGEVSAVHGVVELAIGDEIGGRLVRSVVVASNGSNAVMGIDGATGARNWELGLEDEDIQRVVPQSDELFVVASDSHGGADTRVPILRGIDPVFGTIRWTYVGRPGTAWQWGPPLIVEDRILAMDVPLRGAPASVVSASVHAINVETGEEEWVQSLDGPPEEIYGYDLLSADLSAETPVLLATTLAGFVIRLDIDSGEIMWRALIGSGRVDSITPDAVIVRQGSQGFQLDLQTGLRN